MASDTITDDVPCTRPRHILDGPPPRAVAFVNIPGTHFYEACCGGCVDQHNGRRRIVQLCLDPAVHHNLDPHHWSDDHDTGGLHDHPQPGP